LLYVGGIGTSQETPVSTARYRNTAFPSVPAISEGVLLRLGSLKAMDMKISVLWNVTPYDLVSVDPDDGDNVFPNRFASLQIV
jgi:hypothetical protein